MKKQDTGLFNCGGLSKLNFKCFSSFNVNGLQVNFINGSWIEYVSQIEIKGLHHLQNIFYFRTNKELEVNKKKMGLVETKPSTKTNCYEKNNLLRLYCQNRQLF